jgi:diadenosine tetraphosphate (Ap4A) HIT family hydrolase
LNNKESSPAEKSEGCFLCRYRDEANDAENLVVARGESTIVVLNRFPYNNGHLLIAPLAHKASIVELDDTELLDSMRQLQRFTRIYSEILTPDGFNVDQSGRVAGAGVPGHLHWHLVPLAGRYQLHAGSGRKPTLFHNRFRNFTDIHGALNCCNGHAGCQWVLLQSQSGRTNSGIRLRRVLS